MSAETGRAEFDDVEVIAATDQAIRVNMDGTLRWIPQSVVDDDSEVYRVGDRGTLVIAQWFAIREGLV